MTSYRRSLRPTQRTRATHRTTGWWLAVSAVLNMAWISTFSARFVLLAEVLLLALLAGLARRVEDPDAEVVQQGVGLHHLGQW